MIKILVMDDDEMTRYYLKKLILKKFGFHIFEAGNGLEALQRLEEEIPNVIFLDVSMPIMNGIEFLREIRRNSNYESLSVVVMTAHNDRDTVNELFQLGVQDYILKPFGHFKTFERLREILTEVQKKASQKKAEPVEDSFQVNKSKLVIADRDSEFRSFVNQLLSNRYKVLEAADEKACLKVVQNTNPDIVVLADDFNSVDGKNILKAIHDTESNHKIQIYMCSSSKNAAITSNYDGLIYKTYLTDVFIREFSKSVLKFDSIYEMIKEQFNNFIKVEVISTIRKSLEQKNGSKIELLEIVDQQNLSDKVLCKTELIEEFEKFQVHIGLIGSEKEANCLVGNMKETSFSMVHDTYKYLNFILNSFSERLKISLERFGIKSKLEDIKVKNSILNSFQNEWKLVIPFKIKDCGEFVIGIDLEKNVNEKYDENVVSNYEKVSNL